MILMCFTTISWLQKKDSPVGLWNEFTQWVDNNYIFFEAKSVDWDSICHPFKSTISDSTTSDELFDAMETAILGLKDAHSLLYKPGRLGRHYDYMEGQKAFFDWEVIRRNYIQDSLGYENHVFWGTLDRHIGYIRMDVFDVSEAFLRAIRTLRSMEVAAIIFDVRHNKGGDSDLVPKLLGQMVSQKTALGAYIEKNGPGYNDVTPPVWIYAEPDGPTAWNIPIVVLTDRVSYSATSYFAAMVKGLPGMTLVGQITGGGAGGHLGYQLSNGWLIRVSVSDFIGKDLKTIETGVEPDIHIENTPEDLRQGRDVMLETAMKASF